MFRFLRDHPRVFFFIVFLLSSIFTVGRVLTDTLKVLRKDNGTLNVVGPTMSISATGLTLVTIPFLAKKVNPSITFYMYSNEPPLVVNKFTWLGVIVFDVSSTVLLTILYNDGNFQSLSVALALAVSAEEEIPFLIATISATLFSVLCLVSDIRLETFVIVVLAIIPAFLSEMAKRFQSKMNKITDPLSTLLILGIARLVGAVFLSLTQIGTLWFQSNGAEILASIATGVTEGSALYLLVSLMFLW
jgi:hypothetical protein